MTDRDSVSWRRVVELFERAADLPSDERDAFFAGCGEPPEVVAEAKELLASDAAATEGFLAPSWPATDGPDGRLDTPDPADQPQRVGPYRIVEELGRGGMGRVYLAARDDGQFDDLVAIKLLRRVDGPGSVHRFLAERQILARLRHPHIAYLLDGGLAEGGEPYLVMEHVDGEQIDAFCRRRRLDVAARLRLFLQILAAVEHAHRNLIVHRDLKPSNVLVVADSDRGDGAATVKLLDFGIAKIVDTADPGLTATGHQVMTPLYASPEQMRGEPVTTASDVYQLGVLLYELLTGSRPYRVDPSSSPMAFARAVAEDEPESPSRAASRGSRTDTGPAEADDASDAEGAPLDADVAKLYDGLGPGRRADLDAVLLTALAKDPARRYGSVRELAQDLGRWIEGRPVSARRPGRVERLRRFMRRHRAMSAALVASALLLLSTAGFGVLAILQSRQLELERARAESEAEEARAVAGFLGDIFEGANPERFADEEPTVRDLLDLGAERISELSAPESRIELMGIIGRAYVGLGEHDRATGLGLQRLELARASGDLSAEAMALEDLATADRFESRLEQAAERLEAAREVRLRLDPRQEDVEGWARHLLAHGRVDRQRGLWQEAAEKLERSMELWRSLPNRRGAAAETATALAGVLHFLQRLDEAEAIQRQAIEDFDASIGENSMLAADARHNLAMLLSERGARDEAEAMMTEAVLDLRRIYSADHLNLAAAIGNHGVVAFRGGRTDDARDHFLASLEMRRRLLPEDHPEIANSLHNLGALLIHGDRPAEAEPYLREALALRRTALGDEHPQVAITLSSLADALWLQERVQESLPMRREVVAITASALPADHPDVGAAHRSLARTLERLGEIEEETRQEGDG